MNLIELFAFKQMLKIIMSKWAARPIYVACKLGIPDLVYDNPKTAKEISHLTNSNPDAMYRLLRALASIKIFKESRKGKFKLTLLGKTLTSDALKHQAIMFYSDWHENAWKNLVYSIETGKSGFEKAYGKPFFKWLSENPEAATEAYNSHASHTAIRYHAITRVFDFSSYKKIIDVGGGNGELLINILNDNRDCTGILADLKVVEEQTIRHPSFSKVKAQLDFIETDFFKEVPEKGDLYILSHVLHDWSDEKCKLILQNLQNVMKPDSKLLIIEFIMPGRNKPSPAKLLDLEMLVMGGGGRERTTDEFQDLISKCKLKINKIKKTKAEISIIEVVKL